MRYIVTGGAGFIGSHLVDKLLGRNPQEARADFGKAGEDSKIVEGEKKMKKEIENYHIEHIWRIFLEHKCERILDAGCGNGWLGKFKPDSIEVFGLDLNREKLREAGKHETVVRGDVGNMPFADEFFDGILASHIIEHVPESLALMREFNRVLKVEGILIAISPSPWCGNFWDDYTHVRPYTHESFTKLAKDTGFEVLSCHYLGGLPMPLLGKLRLFSLATKLRASLANLCKRWRGNVFLVAKKSKNLEKGEMK